MDFVPSIFSLDQLTELLEFSPAPPDHLLQQHNIPENNLVEGIEGLSNKPPEPTKKRNFATAFDQNIDDNNNAIRDHKLKKLIHRDVERQRRREGCASAIPSITSPHLGLKGKRSIADHLHETVGYISQLRKKIQNLAEERKKLKQLINPSSNSSGTITELSPFCGQTNVTVKPSRAGMEVVVSTDFIGGLKLSKVLNVITKEGLSIISCSSTKVDGRLLHTIESELNEGRSTDSAELQQKLTDHCT